MISSLRVFSFIIHGLTKITRGEKEKKQEFSEKGGEGGLTEGKVP